VPLRGDIFLGGGAALSEIKFPAAWLNRRNTSRVEASSHDASERWGPLSILINTLYGTIITGVITFLLCLFCCSVANCTRVILGSVTRLIVTMVFTGLLFMKTLYRTQRLCNSGCYRPWLSFVPEHGGFVTRVVRQSVPTLGQSFYRTGRVVNECLFVTNVILAPPVPTCISFTVTASEPFSHVSYSL
jgi:hypothetical protein